MADPAAAATPRSASESHQLKAAKDKSCPFCGQHFTSSSLGRHLDLYIRHKNPKPADGKHVVEEIKKIRGGITRRQTKTPIKRELGTPVSNSRQSIAEDGASPANAQSPGEDDDSMVESVTSKQAFKDVVWQPLGAGNGQPSCTLGTKTPDVRRDVSRHTQKVDLDQRQKLSEEAETAKATEMALRELLKSVGEAKYAYNMLDWKTYLHHTVQRHLGPASSTSTPTHSTFPACVYRYSTHPRPSSPQPRSLPASPGPSIPLVRNSWKL
jgi:hypothetical protein